MFELCDRQSKSERVFCWVMAILVSGSLTFRFVEFDLFCCTPGVIILSTDPPLLLFLLLQRREINL